MLLVTYLSISYYAYWQRKYTAKPVPDKRPADQIDMDDWYIEDYAKIY